MMISLIVIMMQTFIENDVIIKNNLWIFEYLLE